MTSGRGAIALAAALALLPSLAAAQSSLLPSVDSATGREIEATRQTSFESAHLERCTPPGALGRIGAEGGIELAVARNGHVTRVTLLGDDDDETVFRRCVRRAFARVVFARVRTTSTVTLHLVDLSAILLGAVGPPPAPECTTDADCALVCPAPPQCCVPACGCDHAEPTAGAASARASCGGPSLTGAEPTCGPRAAECPREPYLARCELGQCVARTASGALPPSPPQPSVPHGTIVVSPVPDTAPDHEALARIFFTRRMQLLHCYELAMRANPTLTGTLRFHVEVSSVGRMTATSMDEPFDAGTGACMVRTISTWRVNVLAEDAENDAFDVSMQLAPRE
jgi:hypothetical protein